MHTHHATHDVLCKIESHRRVGAQQEGHNTSTAGRARRASLVHGDVPADNNGILAVAGRAVDPVQCVEQRVGAYARQTAEQCRTLTPNTVVLGFRRKRVSEVNSVVTH